MLLVYGIFGSMLYDGIDRDELLKMSGISLALVLVNISCMFVAAILSFKVSVL